MFNFTEKQRKAIYALSASLTMLAVAFGWITESQGAAVGASVIAIGSALANLLAHKNVGK